MNLISTIVISVKLFVRNGTNECAKLSLITSNRRGIPVKSDSILTSGTGEVDTGEALAVLRDVAGISKLNSIQSFVANGGKGDIGTNNALNILRYVAGIVDKI